LQHGIGGGILAGEQRISEGIHANVGARQPQLGKEALDPLARIADQCSVGDALGRAGVGRDTKHSGTPVEASPIEDGAPIVPEIGLERAVVRNVVENIRERLRWTGIKFWHGFLVG
jgi:hypothetical protein